VRPSSKRLSIVDLVRDVMQARREDLRDLERKNGQLA
jgi:hypothetical protein